MRNLQTIFSKMTLEDLNEIQDQLSESNKITEETAIALINLINIVLSEEMGIRTDLLDLAEETIDYYILRFSDLLTYYILVRRGLMQIVHGEMYLTSPDNCLIKPTDRGERWYQREYSKT